MTYRGVFSLLALAAVLLPLRSSSQERQRTAVRPARLEPMQNTGILAGESGKPVYIPAEWGKLVSVQRVTGDRLMLFLQADNGEIYLVRMVQTGQYFYLDTQDQGGVALVIRRSP